MRVLSSLIGALALGALATAAPSLSRRDGVNGDIAQFGLGWSTCAGTILTLSSGTQLVFQPDGNLVLHDAYGGTTFDSQFSDASLPCSNPCNCLLFMQGDGNLVTYINYGQPNQVVGWNSGTAGVNPKTGSTAEYFEVFGSSVAINNFAFIAVVDAQGKRLFTTEQLLTFSLPGLDKIPGTGPSQWCPGSTFEDCGLPTGFR
ncbi:hypothetical protein F5B21DRAFT_507824 [Xylaria acuta]|nr:hypothetical protein F5B21DRAFT_507824 [Xylaria acuta]